MFGKSWKSDQELHVASLSHLNSSTLINAGDKVTPVVGSFGVPLPNDILHNVAAAQNPVPPVTRELFQRLEFTLLQLVHVPHISVHDQNLPDIVCLDVLLVGVEALVKLNNGGEVHQPGWVDGRVFRFELFYCFFVGLIVGKAVVHAVGKFGLVLGGGDEVWVV